MLIHSLQNRYITKTKNLFSGCYCKTERKKNRGHLSDIHEDKFEFYK
jgi:hypothetical protein